MQNLSFNTCTALTEQFVSQWTRLQVFWSQGAIFRCDRRQLVTESNIWSTLWFNKILACRWCYRFLYGEATSAKQYNARQLLVLNSVQLGGHLSLDSYSDRRGMILERHAGQWHSSSKYPNACKKLTHEPNYFKIRKFSLKLHIHTFPITK